MSRLDQLALGVSRELQIEAKSDIFYWQERLEYRYALIKMRQGLEAARVNKVQLSLKYPTGDPRLAGALEDLRKRVLSVSKDRVTLDLVPLPPPDMITALFLLTSDADEKVRATAIESAGKLPDRILSSALRDEEVAPPVLGWFLDRLAQPDVYAEMRQFIDEHAWLTVIQ